LRFDIAIRSSCRRSPPATEKDILAMAVSRRLSLQDAPSNDSGAQREMAKALEFRVNEA